MSRKKNKDKGKESHEGENYSPWECVLIFFSLIRGLTTVEKLAESLVRSPAGILNCWKRICTNSTDYRDKRDLKRFKLFPFSDKPYPFLNGYAKYFIQKQIFEVKQKSNAKKISQQTGIPVQKVQDWIDKKSESFQRRKTNMLLDD
jgi:hypothetical protein